MAGPVVCALPLASSIGRMPACLRRPQHPAHKKFWVVAYEPVRFLPCHSERGPLALAKNLAVLSWFRKKLAEAKAPRYNSNSA